MLSIKATRLRTELFHVLDRILETGEEVEIERNGRLLRIAPKKPPCAWDRLVERPGAVSGDSGDLAQVEWSQEWKP